MASTYIEIAPTVQTTIVGSVEISNDSGNPVPVSAIDLDIRNLTFANDKVDISGSSVTFTATDLDIRDLTFATDKVDASGSEVSLDATTLAALENITVSATNLDIRDLAFASDKVDASGTILGANSGIDIGDVTINNAAGVAAVNIQDGGNSITIDASSLPLPTGASTSALQLPDNHQVTVSNFPATQPISGIVTANQGGTWTVQPGNTANTTAWKVDGSAVTQPISASTLPLPTGAATSALQTQPGVDIGDVTINNSAGAFAVNIQDGGNSITVDGTVAFSNTTIAVTNTGTFATQAAQSGTWNVTNISGTVSLPTGAATAALQTQPGVDIGDVTINNASGASAVNIQDGGNSITVDGTITTTAGTLSTAALTNISGSATSVQLLASTAGRKMATFFNDSSSTMYLKFGTTASTTSYTVLMRPFDYYEIPAPTYTGRIDAIWDSATGAVRITELT